VFEGGGSDLLFREVGHRSAAWIVDGTRGSEHVTFSSYGPSRTNVNYLPFQCDETVCTGFRQAARRASPQKR